jgi:pyridoxine/pyridoxamine 5'-phosphate oxidase
MAVAALIGFLVPVSVHRRDFDIAVHEYVKNPTPDNKATMKREGAESQRIALIVNLEATGVLFVLINLGWLVAARLSGKRW